ncbi:MAG: DUF4835 family protein [Candidatus Marinimicrobia bacterium]|jgi:hypothetical protein|nr:DUF4835 family protein [Candidatus Neomarinimicrobiota bacterium]MBT3937766.1 DUF4835 family protein [Candidatus Neomarinimicrobiota bacterium]MBT3962322.1 DUF4835 family protein [Candidatus Neomarinimicrobiota bacterium]MBT4382575.1 DUF4835 family protein [Candidatus Neomarinimicrobiota bacterium]MBT4635182.1 DUF4835 family protein [Candidatus Neomarinimicrobiota bacterium]
MKHSSINRFLSFLTFLSIAFGQFGDIHVSFDDRLLRGDEKQEVFQLKDDIRRFISSTPWNEEFSDLGIPLHVQFIFEGSSFKSGQKTYICQALFSNGSDQRYFDKGVQFFYSPGNALYFDPVLFDPLSSFLAFYSHLILAGEMDTYDLHGGAKHFEISREIAFRGQTSNLKKGWSSRSNLVDDLTSNNGLRKARLAFYFGVELFQEGLMDEAITEFQNMIDGLDQVYKEFGRDNYTMFFMKVQAETIADIFTKLGRKELLLDMKELDPDQHDIYQTASDSISR